MLICSIDIAILTLGDMLDTCCFIAISILTLLALYQWYYPTHGAWFSKKPSGACQCQRAWRLDWTLGRPVFRLVQKPKTAKNHGFISCYVEPWLRVIRCHNSMIFHLKLLVGPELACFWMFFVWDLPENQRGPSPATAWQTFAMEPNGNGRDHLLEAELVESWCWSSSDLA